MNESENNPRPNIFNRVSLHDLKDDDEEIVNDEISFRKSASPSVTTREKRNSGSAVSHLDHDSSSQGSVGKATTGLRRSQSDAADSPSSLDEKVQVSERVEVSPFEDKHRPSFVSSLKPASPVLRRRQTTIDNAIHNLLQEGKDFLHRKRHHVPLFGHFSKSDTPSPSTSITSSMNSELSHQSNQMVGRTGSIMYNRKTDAITLDSEVSALEDKPESLRIAPSGLVDDFSSSTTGTMNTNKAIPSNIPRPAASPKGGSPEIIQPHQGQGQSNEPLLPNDPSHDLSKANFSKSGSSGWWRYYKQVIGAILVLLTLASFVDGFRSFPAFLLGLLWGSYLSYLVASIVFWFCLPPERYPSFGAAAQTISDEKRETAAEFEEEELLVEDTIIYKGWMNRLPSKYDPHNYHSNGTHSVLVRLDRNILRLSTPRTNLSRHAYCRDPRLSPTLISQELFDMTGALVVLRPKNLAPRRWWSRKYPICILFSAKSINSSPVNTKATTLPAEKEATDLISVNGNSPKNDQIGEVAVDALQSEEITSDSDFADDESDEKETVNVLPSTVSLPSNLNTLSQDAQSNAKTHRKKKLRRMIYLFARSQREKEHWFYKLRQAACHYTYADRRQQFYQRRIGGLSGARFYSTSDAQTSSEQVSLAAKDDDGYLKSDDPLATEWILYISMQKQYERHMRSFLKPQALAEIRGMDLVSMAWKTWMVTAHNTTSAGVTADAAAENPTMPTPYLETLSIDWANALASRVFYDFSKSPHWMGRVQERIQRKLATVRLPYFIETLKLTHLESGTTAPKITSINEPSMNEWGLWIDAKLEYSGGLRLVLETKVNLMKLKNEARPRANTSIIVGEKCCNYENNELPESPESSPDEDAPTVATTSGGLHSQHQAVTKPAGQETAPLSTGKKILNFVDKLAQSKVFQEATENKYLKKWMQGLSDTPFILEVEVVYLCGALALNIPPPPSDRLWWGFRFPPKVVLKARPRVGDRVVNLSHITDWIENKLLLLFEKNLVIPNMDDLTIPMLGGSPICSNYNR